MIETLVVLGLGVYRLALLLTEEDGPFMVFTKFREVLGIQHVNGNPVFWPNNYIAQMLSCIYCTSLTLAIVLWGLSLWQPFVIQALIPFAAASLVVILGKR